MTSAPHRYMRLATWNAYVGEAKPLKSKWGVRYVERTSMLGSTARAPASYPAWKRWIPGMSIPPMNAIRPVLLSMAAAAPTRNEPSLGSKETYDTFERFGRARPV